MQQEALAIRQAKLAPDSWLIAAVHNDISETLVALGRFEDAAKARRRDITIHEMHLGQSENWCNVSGLKIELRLPLWFFGLWVALS